jgi:hypothetical protein
MGFIDKIYNKCERILFMKKSRIVIIGLVVIGLIILTQLNLKSVQGDKTNDVSIQNIQLNPSPVGVGNIFTINAILVNNSTNPIFFHNGYACDPPFSVTFDNHVTV